MSPLEITVNVTASITIRAIPDRAGSVPLMDPPSTAPMPGDTLRAELRTRAIRGLRPPNPATGCRTHRNKSGVVQLGEHRLRVSLLVWEDHHGMDLPEGHVVWHSCATKGCRAAEHLLAGTRQQMDDWRRTTWTND